MKKVILIIRQIALRQAQVSATEQGYYTKLKKKEKKKENGPL